MTDGIFPEAEAAMLVDDLGPKVRPIAYILHVPRLTEVARQHGYALAVHGSLQRELDLIAVPWSDVASDPDDLVKALCKSAGGFIMPNERLVDKPNGRKACIIHLGAGLYIDLSITPKKSNVQTVSCVSITSIKEKLVQVFGTGDFREICLSKNIASQSKMMDCADIVIEVLSLLEDKSKLHSIVEDSMIPNEGVLGPTTGRKEVSRGWELNT